MASHQRVLSLYRNLMRESNKFCSYNYRNYALRRIRDAFKDHKLESNPKVIESLLEKGRTNLEIIKRQVIISSMYEEPTTIIESKYGPKSL